MIKNIIFDVGRVLMFYEPDRYMERLGFDQEEQDAVNQAMFRNPLWNEVDRGKMSYEELLEGFISHAPAYERQIRLAYENAGGTIALMPHTVEWVKGLKERGYHLYILSNYGEYVFAQTQDQMAFLPFMDGSLFSYQCKMIKPEQGIYQHLCQKYGLVPEESIFLDDRLENVEAAQECGIHGIVFTDFEQASAQLEQMLENIQ